MQRCQVIQTFLNYLCNLKADVRGLKPLLRRSISRKLLIELLFKQWFTTRPTVLPSLRIISISFILHLCVGCLILKSNGATAAFKICLMKCSLLAKLQQAITVPLITVPNIGCDVSNIKQGKENPLSFCTKVCLCNLTVTTLCIFLFKEF